MGKLKNFIVHEGRLVALVTLYFLVCFGLIAILKSLFLAEYEVKVTAAGGAIVSALVIAKVVIVLDKTSFGNRFERHAVWSSVLYKTLVYTLAVAMVLIAEKLFHAYHRGDTWHSVMNAFWQSTDRDRALATTICISVSFIGYNLLAEIGRAFGWDTLLRWIFTRHADRGDFGPPA